MLFRSRKKGNACDSGPPVELSLTSSSQFTPYSSNLLQIIEPGNKGRDGVTLRRVSYPPYFLESQCPSCHLGIS